MQSWSRPDPLTRDLIHLINARRHDHGDTDAAIDTLQAFLEQGREDDLLTVLAALIFSLKRPVPSCSMDQWTKNCPMRSWLRWSFRSRPILPIH
jgi:hypothetical protein